MLSAVPAVLRMSTLFLRTLREDPADAEVPSHRLLVRAGYVRRVAPGIYTWLPLGLKVLERVAGIVREEMDRAGGQEVLFPALLPAEPYQVSGRWEDYGDLLFRLQDRRGGDYLLAPTHEEMFTTLVKSQCSSYKDLPLVLYQVQTKYRDEARPRAGVLRGREFVMKDSYSFDVSDAGLQAAYDAHRIAYQRIFERLGLDYRIVAAVSGAMGGSASEEFLAPAPTGEDTFVSCTSCDYAANTEAVQLRAPAEQDPAAWPAMEVLDTPDTPTIATLVQVMRDKGFDVDAAGTLKNVVVTLRHPGGRLETLVVGVPGDREVDVKRLEANVSPAEVLPADVEAVPGLVKGYIGPQGLPDGVRYVVDPLVVRGSSWVTGANEPGRHAVHVVSGRDFEPSGVVPAAEVREGDPCSRCGSALTIGRGIEIGHIFQLGRKYADAFGLDVLGQDGKPVRVTMGSYGIGVSRAVAAIAEQSHDERGLVWPRGVSPADVHVVAVGKGDQGAVAERLAAGLAGQGLRVLLDDRGGSAGVAFKDAELLGVPTVLVVGKALADGLVELRDRRSGSARTVGVDDAVLAVVEDVPRGPAARGGGLSSGTPALVLLEQAGVGHSVHAYEVAAGPGPYGLAGAAALGVEPERMLKTLLADLGGDLVCAVVPVSGSLDLKALAAALGGKRADMADPARAQRSSGYVVGGISPLGQRSRLRTVVDETAELFATVLVSAGRRGLSVEIAPVDLVRLTGAVVADIAR